MKKLINYLLLLTVAGVLVGCSSTEDTTAEKEQTETTEVVEKVEAEEKVEEEKQLADEKAEEEKQLAAKKAEEEKQKQLAAEKAEKEKQEAAKKAEEEKKLAAKKEQNQFSGYKVIEVDGGNKSGYRQANVAVNIGFGKREYWAFTNEHGQLVRVTAKKITLQDDATEPVTSSGRYYSDEAKVPGVESEFLDEGHIIADSLGGVSNAYNITPQNSTLNRHGDQAYMEESIRSAGGATNFEAIITYPNTQTQIPSKYAYTYTIKGNVVNDSFENVNPDEVNEQLGLTKKQEKQSTTTNQTTTTPKSNAAEGDVSAVDTNGNGQVTIAEAKAAGYSMPISSDHWLYQYMRDNDNDGLVGE